MMWSLSDSGERTAPITAPGTRGVGVDAGAFVALASSLGGCGGGGGVVSMRFGMVDERELVG